MHKIIGVALLVVGVFLLVQGHDISHSLVSQARHWVVGSLSNKVTYYFLGGAICCAVGLMQLFRSGKK